MSRETGLSFRNADSLLLGEVPAIYQRAIQEDTGAAFCSLHVRTRPGGSLMKGPCVVIVRHRLGDAGTVERALKHRGVDHRWVLVRLAAIDEMEKLAAGGRLEMLRYTNMHELVEDQRVWPTTNAWMRELKTVAGWLGRTITPRRRGLKGQTRMF